jgi:2-polyprenyl-3-methyl-5-hydroxy-6-metoxy-1,4-benzoquinol methylase
LSFDAVFASEVLEHLIDPWQCVDRLAGLLKPGGIFLASSPNVCHHKIIRQLVAGRFDLRETGPMDRTHLRWFTPSTYRQMFEAAGLRVDQLGPVGPPGPKSKALGLLLPPKQKVCLWVQINIRAVKPGNSST